MSPPIINISTDLESYLHSSYIYLIHRPDLRPKPTAHCLMTFQVGGRQCSRALKHNPDKIIQKRKRKKERKKERKEKGERRKEKERKTESRKEQERSNTNMSETDYVDTPFLQKDPGRTDPPVTTCF